MSINGEFEHPHSEDGPPSVSGVDAQVFISHSSQDAHLANRLVEDCERRGIK
jgi:hypothetical protein